MSDDNKYIPYVIVAVVCIVIGTFTSYTLVQKAPTEPTKQLDEIYVLQQQITALDQSIQDMRAQLEDQETSIEDLDYAVTDVADEAYTIRGTVESINGKVDTLQGTVDTLQGTVNAIADNQGDKIHMFFVEGELRSDPNDGQYTDYFDTITLGAESVVELTIWVSKLDSRYDETVQLFCYNDGQELVKSLNEANQAYYPVYTVEFVTTRTGFSFVINSGAPEPVIVKYIGRVTQIA